MQEKLLLRAALDVNTMKLYSNSCGSCFRRECMCVCVCVCVCVRACHARGGGGGGGMESKAQSALNQQRRVIPAPLRHSQNQKPCCVV